MSALTIVMYHYIRDLRRSRFPRIKGLDIEEFHGQLEYIDTHYSVVRMEDVIAAWHGGRALPENAALLTFDDGYIDHYLFAYPLLKKFGFQGAFFPPVMTAWQEMVLDVNLIHLVLASCDDDHHLVKRLLEKLEKYREEYHLDSSDVYIEQYMHPSRFDTKEVIFVKRVLQKGLPEEVRWKICRELAEEFVGIDEATIARELYMDYDQIRLMVDGGMFFGSHGNNHYWLSNLTDREVETEIDQSLSFLQAVGQSTEDWVMCYPYGDYSDSVLDLLHTRGCRLGLTTEVRVAATEQDHYLKLPRLDTNDLPKRNQ